MRVTDTHVYFYGAQECYSQWYKAGFTYKGLYFKTAEFWMMYCKAMLFKDTDIAEKILNANHSYEAKALGKRVRNFVKEVWERHCKRYVYIGNHLKFSQNPNILKVILTHAGKVFVEASIPDVIWGVGLSEDNDDILDHRNWKGTNWLGDCITDVANTLAIEYTGVLFDT